MASRSRPPGDHGRRKPGQGSERRRPTPNPKPSKRAKPGAGKRGFGPYHKESTDDQRRRSAADATSARSSRDDRRRASPLRVVRGADGRGKPRKQSKPQKSRAKRAARRGEPAAEVRAAPRGRRRRRGRRDDVRDEILRLDGARGPGYYDDLVRAADAFARDHERDAARILRPLRDALPDSPSVRELLGLALYRARSFPAASKELEEFVRLTGSVEQHPVLMDCYRAQRRWRKVHALWDDLRRGSSNAELVTEGRIVAAGALADQGNVDEALRLLDRGADSVRAARPHHLRLWYALGDLQERAGNLPRARTLFDRIIGADPRFADAAERRAALG